MKLAVTGAKTMPSKVNSGMVTMIFFQDEMGRKYKTYIDETCGNKKRWVDIQRGDVLTGLTLKYNDIVDADSLFTKVTQ
jgi:hypothetical protein